MSSRRISGLRGAQKAGTTPAAVAKNPTQTPADYHSTNNDTEMTDVTNGAVGEKTPFWKKKKSADGGKVIKKKSGPNSLNKRIKKYVQPKNAVVCLNEVVGGNLTYITEEEGLRNTPFCMSVEVDGQKFQGYGSSKTLAKQAAAEAALVSFVKPPKTGEGESKEEDQTPWRYLASFAMFKLFNDWREGRVGLCSSNAFNPMSMDAASQAMATGKPGKVNKKVAAARLAAQAKAVGATPQPKPAKILPAKAAEMHPVMLLNQMRPTATFETTIEPGSVKVSSVIDSITFQGEGANAKKAKLQLAIAANGELFGVQTVWQEAS